MSTKRTIQFLFLIYLCCLTTNPPYLLSARQQLAVYIGEYSEIIRFCYSNGYYTSMPIGTIHHCYLIMGAVVFLDEVTLSPYTMS